MIEPGGSVRERSLFIFNLGHGLAALSRCQAGLSGRMFVGEEAPIPANTLVTSVGSQNTAITCKDVGGDKTTQEVELIVFLHPHVIHSQEDANDVLHEIGKEAPLVKKWQDQNQPAPPK